MKTRRPSPSTVFIFDICRGGVILRAVILVQAVLACGMLYVDLPLALWLDRFALLCACTVPATLLWLFLGCCFKTLLARLPPGGQLALGAATGALAGVYACAVALWVGLADAPAWAAAACTGMLLSLMLIGWLIVRAKRLRPAAVLARMNELQMRIRPHFLFNTLNSAVALVRTDPERAETVLEDLADLFRRTLHESGDTVTLAQEIELVQRYLEIESVRFGDRLRVQWALEPEVAGFRLPPLILQPLVENAVRHGVEPSASGADIRISTKKRGDNVVIKVGNTVPSGRGTPGSGIALTNVRERIELLYDMEADVRVRYRDGIYTVRLQFPKLADEEEHHAQSAGRR